MNMYQSLALAATLFVSQMFFKFQRTEGDLRLPVVPRLPTVPILLEELSQPQLISPYHRVLSELGHGPIGNRLPKDFLPEICILNNGVIDQSLGRSIVLRYLEENSFNPQARNRGNMFKVTTKTGETETSFILLGVSHHLKIEGTRMPTFYEKMFGGINGECKAALQPGFQDVYRREGIQLLYNEIGEGTHCHEWTGGNRYMEDLGCDVVNCKMKELESLDSREDLRKVVDRFYPRTEDSSPQIMPNNSHYGMWKFYFAGCQELYSFYDTYIVGLCDPTGPRRKVYRTLRNYEWMKTFSENAVDKGIPAAYMVGCAHLYGEHGLLNLCAARGWKVEHIDDVYPDVQWPVEEGWKPRECPLFRMGIHHLNHHLEWNIDTSGLPPVRAPTFKDISHEWASYQWLRDTTGAAAADSGA